MSLKNTYYKVVEVCPADQGTVFRVALLPECDIYRGHFPGHPVCPGACNIELIRECATQLVGKELFISAIKRCRFTAMLMPDTGALLDVTLNVTCRQDGSCAVKATIAGSDKTFVEYEGEMTTIQPDEGQSMPV